jgi:hypothetical protein
MSDCVVFNIYCTSRSVFVLRTWMGVEIFDSMSAANGLGFNNMH